LPCAQPGKLQYQRKTYDKRQPFGQRLFALLIHVILPARPRGSVVKLVVIVLLLAIVASLGSGLFYLAKDDQNSPRVLKALKIRVALSATLVIFLILSYYMGWINK
jgi:hypothetical protein